MNQVSVGVVGIGGMGSHHARNIFNGAVRNARLAAVADINPARLDWAKQEFGDAVNRYGTAQELFEAQDVEAVLIATPHYDHPPLAEEAFAKGLHVLVEKPAGVYTKQVREMNEAAAQSGKIFSIMYNQRTNPVFQKLKELIECGELGEIKRTNWIITNWYRPQSYYDSGDWRATWEGEGGGVLLNQNPHNLDLWQWTCGMPQRIRAFCHFGKHHDIEVEDDVTAYVEYANGATGVYVTSTGDAPGTNRLEVTGDRGKIVVEGNRLVFWRLRVSERQFNREFKGGFGEPESWKCEVPVSGRETAHVGIMNNWIESILRGTPLLAPGEEGIHGLTLSNAMLLSTWTDDWVELPIDEDLFYQKLKEKIESSTVEKKRAGSKTLDVTGTH